MSGYIFSGHSLLNSNFRVAPLLFHPPLPTTLVQPVNLLILLFRHPANENLSLAIPQKTYKDKIAPCLNGAGNYHSHRLASRCGYVAIRLRDFLEKNISWKKNSLQLSY